MTKGKSYSNQNSPLFHLPSFILVGDQQENNKNQVLEQVSADRQTTQINHTKDFFAAQSPIIKVYQRICLICIFLHNNYPHRANQVVQGRFQMENSPGNEKSINIFNCIQIWSSFALRIEISSTQTITIPTTKQLFQLLIKTVKVGSTAICIAKQQLKIGSF